MVPTRSPEHPALRFAVRHDTEGFWSAELATRAEPPYPPHNALVNVLVSGPDERAVSARCSETADWLAALIAQHRLTIEVLGPAPCPIAKAKDRFRWHVILKGPDHALGRVVRYASSRLDGGEPVRVTIDRDPVSLL